MTLVDTSVSSLSNQENSPLMSFWQGGQNQFSAAPSKIVLDMDSGDTEVKEAVMGLHRLRHKQCLENLAYLRYKIW